jgi:hypothetical protein
MCINIWYCMHNHVISELFDLVACSPHEKPIATPPAQLDGENAFGPHAVSEPRYKSSHLTPPRRHSPLNSI